jgi:hypothetical protein
MIDRRIAQKLDCALPLIVSQHFIETAGASLQLAFSQALLCVMAALDSIGKGDT